jgi:hypothetical protein
MDVLDIEPASCQMPAHQDSAVAIERFLLGAHKGKPKSPSDAIVYALDPLTKQIRPGDAIVLHSAILITGWILAARPKFSA